MKLLVTGLIVWVFFGMITLIVTPPDPMSRITAMVAMLIVFGVVFFAVSRFKSFKQTPEGMKRVIVALVCLLSVTTVLSLFLLLARCRS